MVPGSISNQAISLFQEGLRLPGVKVVEGGEPIRSVIEIMKANSRLPDFLEGDMWAGISAAGLGERRIGEVVAKYGRDTFLAAVASFLEYGEQVSLRALGQLPEGRSTSPRSRTTAASTVSVEIGDGSFVVDLRDNPDQDPFSANLGHDASMIARR
jgi:N-methylhydantoinase B